MKQTVQAEAAVGRAPIPRSAEQSVAPSGAQWFAVHGWDNLPWLWHGFSTRRGGLSTAYRHPDGPPELNLGFTPDDDREIVAENRRLLARAITGDSATPLVTVSQFHSNVVVSAAPQNGAAGPPQRADGLMTDRPGILLGILTADCIPVLVADCKLRVVGAFHAGWRGTAQRIVEYGIARMGEEFGSLPEDMVAAIGPGIGPCCYAVGEEVRSAFHSQFSYAEALFQEAAVRDASQTGIAKSAESPDARGKPGAGSGSYLNLAEANRRQLLSAGLDAGAIQLVGGCTACQPELFFSHRASGGRAGRMMSVIGICG